eukprot:1729343-Amphidinium_carterae.1
MMKSQLLLSCTPEAHGFFLTLWIDRNESAHSEEKQPDFRQAHSGKGHYERQQPHHCINAVPTKLSQTLISRLTQALHITRLQKHGAPFEKKLEAGVRGCE